MCRSIHNSGFILKTIQYHRIKLYDGLVKSLGNILFCTHTRTHRHLASQNKRDYTFCQTWKMNLTFKRRNANEQNKSGMKIQIGLGFTWIRSNRFMLSVLEENLNLCRDFMIFIALHHWNNVFYITFEGVHSLWAKGVKIRCDLKRKKDFYLFMTLTSLFREFRVANLTHFFRQPKINRYKMT